MPSSPDIDWHNKIKIWGEIHVENWEPKEEDAEMSEWISVKDRLPDRTMPPHDVLVYHDLNCGMFIDRAWYSHEKNKWRSVVGMNLKVTHWMPLPEPPEEDDHGRMKRRTNESG